MRKQGTGHDLNAQKRNARRLYSILAYSPYLEPLYLLNNVRWNVRYVRASLNFVLLSQL